MDVQLVFEDLFPAHSHGAYTLSLLDPEKKRILPLLIGVPEAQAINLELEGKKTDRPLVHDLLLNFLNEFDAIITHILIYAIVDGVFYAQVHYSHNGEEKNIESRTSDAVCLAIKCGAPIYTTAKIMDEVAYDNDGNNIAMEEPNQLSLEDLLPKIKNAEDYSEYTIVQLEKMLQEAINHENYGKAAKIRDELSKRR